MVSNHSVGCLIHNLPKCSFLTGFWRILMDALADPICRLFPNLLPFGWSPYELLFYGAKNLHGKCGESTHFFGWAVAIFHGHFVRRNLWPPKGDLWANWRRGTTTGRRIMDRQTTTEYWLQCWLSGHWAVDDKSGQPLQWGRPEAMNARPQFSNGKGSCECEGIGIGSTKLQLADQLGIN